MSSRERKRADRRKRKERSAAAADGGDADAEGDAVRDEVNGFSEPSPTDLAAEAEAGVSRSELKNREARERPSRTNR